MPRDYGKGGKNRKKAKNNPIIVQRQLRFKEDLQDYAQITKMLGSERIEAFCFDDNKKRLCHIRGKIKKKEWMNIGDFILVSIREFEEEKADVIQRYTPDEVERLKILGELPDTVKITNVGEIAQDENDDDFISFGKEEKKDELNIDKL
jgi:translation initiation factor 1A